MNKENHSAIGFGLFAGIKTDKGSTLIDRCCCLRVIYTENFVFRSLRHKNIGMRRTSPKSCIYNIMQISII